jgi:acetylornithine deacetylase
MVQNTAISNQIKQEVQDLLLGLIHIPSIRGKEGPAMRFLHNIICTYVDQCNLVTIDDSLIEDPDYAFPLPGFSYEDTPNLECIIRGRGESQSIVFNTHIDVVPPSEGQTNAFSPHSTNGIIYGRGACDAKGQVATLLALAMLIKEQNIRPKGDLVFHIVIEEENGGNGTLAMVRRGVYAQAAVVLEPSELAVIPAVRGAVWFQLETFGHAGHSGSKSSTVSALKNAVQAMGIMERYHDRLLEESRGNPLFDCFQDPMPITFGECHAGKWPASVPSEATLRGVLGFLPNKDRFQVQKELRHAIESEGDDWLRDHFKLTFPMLNSDGYSLKVDHSLVTHLVNAAQINECEGDVKGMTAACDAWFYNNMADIPTVVFGPGSLSHAHSKDEQIRLEDILKAAQILLDFVKEY